MSPPIPVFDGESDCEFNPQILPETPQNESFHIPPQVVQHGFPTPVGDSAGCWQETIPPSDLWKACPPESSIIAEIVQFYQPSQDLAAHIDPPTFDNTSPHPLISFTMTCPVPHCCYQCQNVGEIWRHITWTHVHPQPGDGIEGIVEKVVLGNV